MMQRMANSRPAVPLLLLVLLAALAPLSMDAVLPSLPALAGSFHIAPEDAQAVITAFMIGFSVGQIFWGPLADRFGRRPILLFCLAAFALCNLGIALATNLQAVLIGRGLAGLSACAGMVMSRTLVIDTTQAEDRHKVIAALASAMFLAPALGPVVGGVLQAWAGWRAIFCVLAVVPAFLLLYIALRFEETLAKPDPNALHLRTVFSTWWQLLRNPHFLRPTLVVAAMSGAMYAFIAASPLVLMKQHGLTSTQFGIAYMFVAASFILGGQVARRAQVGRAKPWVAAAVSVALLTGVSIVASAHFPPADDTVALAWFMGSAILFYAMLGITMPLSMAAGLRDCEAVGARASGLQGFLQATGGASASAIVSLIPDATLGIGGFIAAAAMTSLVVLAFSAPWRDLPDILKSFVQVAD